MTVGQASDGGPRVHSCAPHLRVDPGAGSGTADGAASGPETAPVPPGLVLVLAVLAVSTGSIFVRFAEAPALATAFWRMAFAVAVIAPLTLRRAWREAPRMSRREVWAGLAAGFFLALHFATWIRSLDFTTVAASTVIVATTPLWVALFAPLFGTERASGPMVLGILLSFTGAAVVGFGDFEISQAALGGDLLALAGAAAAALYLLFGRRLRARVSIGTHLLYCYGTATLFLGLFALLADEPLLGLEPSAYGWFLALALVPQLLGHSGYNWALRWASTSLVALVELGEPLVASLLAWWLLAELPRAATAWGGVLILAGFLVAARSERRK